MVYLQSLMMALLMSQENNEVKSVVLTDKVPHFRSAVFSDDGKSIAAIWRNNIYVSKMNLKEDLIKCDSVSALSISSGNNYLAGSSTDKTIRVWYLADLKLRHAIRHKGSASLCFSPDENILASGDFDGTISLWDIKTAELRHAFTGHEKGVYAVVFSPCGMRLASASSDQTIRIWDMATEKELFVLKGNSSSLGNLAFSPDGKKLASRFESDGLVRIWDVLTGKEDYSFKALSAGPRIVCFSPDGKTLAVGSSAYITVLDLTTRKFTRLLESKGGVKALKFSADSKTLSSVGGDRTLQIWSLSPDSQK